MEEMYRRHGSRLCFCRCLVPYVPFSLRSPRVTPILVPLVRYERRENRTRQGNEDVTRKEVHINSLSFLFVVMWERNVKRIRMKNPVGAFAGRSWSVPSVGRSPPILLSTVSCPYPPTTHPPRGTRHERRMG